jgi:hypothetical protein
MFRVIIDDGSGTAPVVLWRESAAKTLNGLDPATTLVLGAYLSVHGRLDRRHGSCEITASRVFRSNSPNAELLWWCDVARVHERVYAKPCPPIVVRNNYL